MKALKNLLPVLSGVLTDYRVIATFLGFLFVIMIAGFIVNYTKKAPRPKKEKKPAPEAKPQEASEETQEAETEETE